MAPVTVWLRVYAVLAAAMLAASGRAWPAPVDVRSNGGGYPLKRDWGAIVGADPARNRAAGYRKLLCAELGLYPPSLLRRAGVRSIVLAERLAVNGQLRAAVPDFEFGTLYLDVGRGAGSDEYRRSVIHHELFHMIDRAQGRLYRDPEWSALNPKGFCYGSGGAAVQDDPLQSVATRSLPGFVTRYAATAVEEDRAEVFAHLMVAPVRMRDHARADAVVAAKVRLMKRQLRAFCPDVNDVFWTSVWRARARSRPSASGCGRPLSRGPSRRSGSTAPSAAAAVSAGLARTPLHGTPSGS